MKLNEWRCRASSFHDHAKSVVCLTRRLTTIHNRSLLYDVYNYVSDMSSTLTLCSRYLHWIGKFYFEFYLNLIYSIIIDNDQKCSNIFLSGDVEPGSKRGGLAGEFLVYYFLKFFLSYI